MRWRAGRERERGREEDGLSGTASHEARSGHKSAGGEENASGSSTGTSYKSPLAVNYMEKRM